MIEEFKKEHAVITDNFKKIKKFGVHLKEGQNMILSIQMNILNHLDKEDNELYPVLKNTVKSERKVNDTLNLFYENISAVSNTAMHFFENFSRKAENQLAMETEWLFETLTWRIQREESLIFAMYEDKHLKQ